MVITSHRVWREVDRRAKDGRLIDDLQAEIRVLRAECQRLAAVLRALEAR